jgi:hypothetical protein
MKSLLILSTLLSAFEAGAATTYYTFTGKIVFIPQDDGGYAASHGIKVGNTVTQVWAVDTGRLGFDLQDGVRTDKPDTSGTGGGYFADMFYDSLVTPSLFSPAVTDLSSGSYFGFRTVTTLGTQSRYSTALQVIIGPRTGQTQVIVTVPDSGKAEFLPKIGTTVSVVEGYTRGTDASSASLTMTCTAIGTTLPNIAVRPAPGAGPRWADIDWNGGTLLVRTLPGRAAAASIRDASGRRVFAAPRAETIRIPAASLPRSPFVLELTGNGASFARAFAP